MGALRIWNPKIQLFVGFYTSFMEVGISNEEMVSQETNLLEHQKDLD